MKISEATMNATDIIEEKTCKKQRILHCSIQHSVRTQTIQHESYDTVVGAETRS